MIFKDTHAYTRSCESYQKCVGREKMNVFPLQTMDVKETFEK
jgi:hypothetical protein